MPTYSYKAEIRSENTKVVSGLIEITEEETQKGALDAIMDQLSRIHNVSRRDITISNVLLQTD